MRSAEGGGSPPTSVHSIGISLLFAVFGYITTALHSLRSLQHRGRVDRVNEQLKSLYGPLLACVTASKSSYDAMLQQASLRCGTGEALSPSEFRAVVQADPTGAVAQTYRRWVREVLMPLSEKAARIVMERADLLEGAGISPLLLQLVAHVSAYKVILARWDDGAEAEQSRIPFPDDLHQWVDEGFNRLKRRQSELLGIAPDGTQGSPLMRIIASKL